MKFSNHKIEIHDFVSSSYSWTLHKIIAEPTGATAILCKASKYEHKANSKNSILRFGKLSMQEKYEFIGHKDTQYDGLFYVAVKTTGIFCLPSCRARKPLQKNVIFYDTLQEAIGNGFRACKVCRPNLFVTYG